MESVQRQHRMPFGAEPLDDSHVRFRLWAPAAERVDLCLEAPDAERLQPLARRADGWFECTSAATPGRRYQFRINGEARVPDPASRRQAADVHGPSEIIDPRAWPWRDGDWRGRPWSQAVIYELHVGSFTPEGTFAGVRDKLDYLADLGVTALELMPVADFPGDRNWGYDGTLLFAPAGRYGRPEDLKSLIDAAHARGLMVFLDVVYNHFGPEGNYLHLYAPQFFTDRHHTPWGAAINFDGEHAYWVRQFFIHNALYWLEEYHLDGLRFDAVHAIVDDAEPDILTELAERVAAGPGRARHIHLVLENDHNAARYLARDASNRPRWYTAQWNDDIHHALHVLLTGETNGYYIDYADRPLDRLARCLSEGFAYQGEVSAYRDGRRRGEPSADLPLTAFVSFLQNHDQVGNRALGERIHVLADPGRIHAALALLLLAPSPPLLFMGQEWGATQPFPFFCDFGEELAEAVTEGRRSEFADFSAFVDPRARARIPDPMDPATFACAVLDWDARQLPEHRAWLDTCRRLLQLRRGVLGARLDALAAGGHHCETTGRGLLRTHWQNDTLRLTLAANLGGETPASTTRPPGRLLYTSAAGLAETGPTVELPAWSTSWWLHEIPRDT